MIESRYEAWQERKANRRELDTLDHPPSGRTIIKPCRVITIPIARRDPATAPQRPAGFVWRPAGVVRIGSRAWKTAVAAGTAVYIGRACPRSSDPLCRVGSKWANPYPEKQFGRAGSIDLYSGHLLTHGGLMEDLWELSGKVLGCWCKPLACHGDLLVEQVNKRVSNPLED